MHLSIIRYVRAALKVAAAANEIVGLCSIQACGSGDYFSYPLWSRLHYRTRDDMCTRYQNYQDPMDSSCAPGQHHIFTLTDISKLS